jgi:hypothetical protein
MQRTSFSGTNDVLETPHKIYNDDRRQPGGIKAEDTTSSVVGDFHMPEMQKPAIWRVHHKIRDHQRLFLGVGSVVSISPRHINVA